MKKKLAFFLGISASWAFAAGNVAIALNRYCRNAAYDIVVYHSGISEQDKKAFAQISNCILREYVLGEDFVEFMLKSLPESCRFRSRERLMCFAHFETFHLLNEYENVVWLDADVLIREDFTDDILQFAPVAFPADSGHTVREQFFDLISCKYDLEKKAICVGMMVLNDSLPYEEIYHWCYKEARNFAKYSKNPEQAVINLCLQEFGLQPMIIPTDWHCLHPDRQEESITSKGIHFGTERKVWNDKELFVLYPEWYRNHVEWIKLGGSVSREYKIGKWNPKEILSQFMQEHKSLFMFEKVPANSSILIYGGGRLGHKYVEQIMQINYCTIVAVLDKYAPNIDDLPVPVLLPEAVRGIKDYDYIVIALRDETMISEAEQSLLQAGVMKGKLVYS